MAAKLKDAMFNLFTDFSYDDISENVFARKVTAQVAPSLAMVDAADVSDDVEIVDSSVDLTDKQNKIEDFGEKIGGARKDLYCVYRDLLGSVSSDDVYSSPMSKTWPKPNYEKLLDSGVEPWKVHAIRTLRDCVPRKPRRFLLSYWSKQFLYLRELAINIMDDKYKDFDEFQKSIIDTNSFFESHDFMPLYNFYSKLGHSEDCSNMRLRHRSKIIFNGKKYRDVYVLYKLLSKSDYRINYLAVGKSQEDALQNYIDSRDNAKKSNQTEKRDKSLDDLYSVYRDNRTLAYFIGRKVGNHVVRIKTPFIDLNSAIDYKKAHLEDLDSKFLEMKNIPNERGSENLPRMGQSYRDGDVTPDEFSKAFGFRGVEFGNYVEADRRQQDLNDAYDALMDLSKITKLPPRALSLGGQLGLAFGARGHGGKNPPSAHYESVRTVINLTKKKGAGSLGHEWFHALDNLLAREHKLGRVTFMSEAYKVVDDPYKDSQNAMKNLEAAIRQKTDVYERSSKLDEVRTKPYWGTTVEVMARCFEAYLCKKLKDDGIQNDYLANYLGEDSWNLICSMPYAYPTDSEIEKISPDFDRLFENIRQREEGDNIVLYSASSDPHLSELSKFLIPYEHLEPHELGLLAFGEQVLGIDTAFYDGEPSLHGHFDPDTNTIYLNRSSECSLPWVFAHEAFHALKKADPSLYSDLMAYAGGAEAFSADKMQAYRLDRSAPEMPDDIVRQEMLADAFADYTTGRRTIIEMAQTQPNLLRRATNFLSRAMDEFKECFFGKRREEIKEKYPSVTISREQFSDLSHGLEYIQQALMKEEHLTRGQNMILSLLADAPKIDGLHSPYSYSPDKQFEFDCKAVASMFELHPEISRDKICAAVSSFSPCGSLDYEHKLLISSWGRGVGR